MCHTNNSLAEILCIDVNTRMFLNCLQNEKHVGCRHISQQDRLTDIVINCLLWIVPENKSENQTKNYL